MLRNVFILYVFFFSVRSHTQGIPLGEAYGFQRSHTAFATNAFPVSRPRELINNIDVTMATVTGQRVVLRYGGHFLWSNSYESGYIPKRIDRGVYVFFVPIRTWRRFQPKKRVPCVCKKRGTPYHRTSSNGVHNGREGYLSHSQDSLPARHRRRNNRLL